MSRSKGKNYYKGRRSGSMGFLTKHARFMVDWKKVRTYVVPEGIAESGLQPYVSKNVKSRRSHFIDNDGPLSGAFYIQQWKANSLQYEEMQSRRAASKA